MRKKKGQARNAPNIFEFTDQKKHPFAALAIRKITHQLFSISLMLPI